MRVVIHARQGDGSITAFAQGCQAAGYSVAWQRPALWTERDFDPLATVVAVHGLSGRAALIHAFYRERGVPAWIIDLPRLRDELLAIGFYLNDLQWLPGATMRPAKNVPTIITGRLASVVLVCGQKPGDNAHGMDVAAVHAWARKTVARTRAVTSLPVVYRRHPLDETYCSGLGADEVSNPAHTDLRVEFARSAVVVTHNSTAGWEAIAAGVPVHVTDPRASYAEYATALGDVQPLSLARRREALERAASTQWTMYELAKPDVISRLFAQHDAPALAGVA